MGQRKHKHTPKAVAGATENHRAEHTSTRATADCQKTPIYHPIVIKIEIFKKPAAFLCLMLSNKSLIELKEFGLNSYESRIWVALLSRGTSTAGELSDIANVPRSRSYDVLESLQKKGFVVVKHGKPIRYVAVSPDDAIVNAKDLIEAVARKQEETAESMKSGSLLGELSSIYRQGFEASSDEHVSGSIFGRKNIHNHLESLMRKAKKSIALATTAEAIESKHAVLKSAAEKAAGSDIEVRILVAGSFDKSKIKMPKGIKVRKAGIKSRFCVVDGEDSIVLLFNSGDVHPEYETAVWISNPDFGSGIEMVFNAAWKRSTPL